MLEILFGVSSQLGHIGLL